MSSNFSTRVLSHHYSSLKQVLFVAINATKRAICLWKLTEILTHFMSPLMQMFLKKIHYLGGKEDFFLLFCAPNNLLL